MEKIKRLCKFVFVYRPLTGNSTKWQAFGYHCLNGLRRTTMVAIFAVWAYASGFVWNKVNPVTVYAEKTVVQVVTATTTAPVLERIAKCESGGNQMKNGQVQINVNKNGSVDIGKYMINLTIWGKTATKMGYDLTKQSDNESFAEWLYLNKGTGDWSASQSCWYK